MGLSSLGWRKARAVENGLALRDAVAERIERRIVRENAILYEGNDVPSESNQIIE